MRTIQPAIRYANTGRRAAIATAWPTFVPYGGVLFGKIIIRPDYRSHPSRHLRQSSIWSARLRVTSATGTATPSLPLDQKSRPDQTRHPPMLKSFAVLNTTRRFCLSGGLSKSPMSARRPGARAAADADWQNEKTKHHKFRHRAPKVVEPDLSRRTR